MIHSFPCVHSLCDKRRSDSLPMRFSCEGFLGYKEGKGVGDCLKPKERIFVRIAWFLVTLLPVYLTYFFIFYSPLACTACTPLPRCLYPIPPCLYCLNLTPTALDHFCTRSKPSFSTARSFSHYVQTVFFERSDFDKKNIYDAILTVFNQYHHKI